MGTKLNPGTYDCYANALPDEPMFILLARDPLAPTLIDSWAIRRSQLIDSGEKPDTDRPMVTEAFACAGAMRSWRVENDGKWRVPLPGQSLDHAGHHIDERGRFKSDKYPDLPPDKIVLSFGDPLARRALAVLAMDYRTADPELAADITHRLHVLEFIRREGTVAGDALPPTESP